MTREEFELILESAATRLGDEVRANTKYHSPDAFQQRVFDVLVEVARGQSININPTFHPHAFPDIRANGFGVEVKTTNKDTWLSVGNSVFEGMRDPGVKQIYVMFGKMGGMPSVKWGRYEDRITHVRISHAPRFVLEMDRDSSLFGKMKIAYDDFAQLTPEGKMRHVRDYSRARLQTGERLWWLEDENDQGQPLEYKLYIDLSHKEKRDIRAEVAILFPQIVAHSRAEKYKYVEPALYLLKSRNIFCTQARDLFSAGSVAGPVRGENYILKALQKIEVEMREAAVRLDDALFVEHWGESVSVANRIPRWLAKADANARGWKPSEHLFLK